MSLSANLLLKDPRDINKKKIRFFVLDFQNKALFYKMDEIAKEKRLLCKFE